MTVSSISAQTVLVTGGTGFIGSHLCRALNRAGCDVHSISRTKRPKENGHARYWKGDLAEIAVARKIVADIRPDVIFHLASHVVGARDLACVMPTFRDNLVSTVNVLTAAAESGCRRILLAGSLEESVMDPSSAVPCSPYAASKSSASAYGRMFHALYGLPVVIARLFMVYGPGQADHRKLIPYVILSLLKKEVPRLTSGNRLVDWIYVEDVVDGLVAAAQAPGVEGKAVEIGSGNLVSVREIADHLTQLVDPEIQPLFGAVPDRPMEQVRTASVADTHTLTGWKPRTSLDHGLKQTVAWYERQLRSGVLDSVNG